MFTWNHGTMNYLRTYTQNQLIHSFWIAPMLNSSILLLIALVVGHPEI